MGDQTTRGIAERLVAARGSRSQKEVAEAAGMSPSALNRVEGGTRNLRLDELVAVADVLGIEPQEILGTETPAFALRADSGPGVQAAMDRCSSMIKAFETIYALTG